MSLETVTAFVQELRNGRIVVTDAMLHTALKDRSVGEGRIVSLENRDGSASLTLLYPTMGRDVTVHIKLRIESFELDARRPRVMVRWLDHDAAAEGFTGAVVARTVEALITTALARLAVGSETVAGVRLSRIESSLYEVDVSELPQVRSIMALGETFLGKALLKLFPRIQVTHEAALIALTAHV